LKSEQFPEDSGPLAHPVRPTKYREINNFYTTTVYEKGSEVTRMIATLLGKDLFKKGMDLYFERHDGEAATVEDFVACFAEVSGRDLTQFSLWYHQAGTPLVTASCTYDAAARTFTLSLEQMVPPTPGQSTKESMHIPLRLGLISEDGQPMVPGEVTGAEFTKDVLHLTERSQTVVFHGIPSRPVLSLNRSFSAPINLHFDQSAADLSLIARFEADHFARWQALTDLALPVLLEAARDTRQRKPVTCDPALIEALLAAAADESLEPAFRAQVLSLPSEADIARELGSNNDPDAIHAGRQSILKQIADAGQAIFAGLFDTMVTPGAFSPDAASAGRRALRNAALTFLSLSDGTPVRSKAAFDAANNMTDLSAALVLLAHRFPDAAETKEALATFKARFESNPLVIDKWLAIQAGIPGAAALARVRSLIEDPLFAGANPNRVRALLGTFIFGNPTGFNRADGEGYRLLADKILEIDPRNPQLAARLLTSMRSWRSLEPVRADHARAALMQIDRAADLSTDVRDIVERTLKE
jgi:aminopeptidase N